MLGRALACPSRIRIQSSVYAFIACGFLSTALVATPFVLLQLWNIARMGAWGSFDVAAGLVRGILIWLIISVIGLFLAAPFVPVATWVGARLRIEGLLYYAVLGGLAACIPILILFGVPRETPFGSVTSAWSIGPLCGVAWGAAWWYLHRRWISIPEKTA